MTLSINTIGKSKQTIKKRKRVGRGNSSGKGTYSGRGLKGQKARSGVSNLKRLGMKQTLLRTPKLRGFKSLRPKNQIVKIGQINEYFKDGEIVSPQTLVAKGLIKKTSPAVKILGKDKLKIKKLSFKGVKMSASVAATVKENKK